MCQNYFEHNDLKHRLNINKVIAKKHEVVYSWAADKISVLKILFCKHYEYVSIILPYY